MLLNLCNMAPLLYRKNVITIHDVSPLRNPSWFSFAFRTYYKWMLPAIARKTLRVLTDSTFSKHEISELLHVPPQQIDVVQLAVPTNIAKLLDNKTENENGKYILAVSSIDPRKNFAGLVRAFLKSQLPDVKLILAGGQDRIFSDTGLKDDIRNADNIVFRGYLTDSDLVALYQHALCLVYPSLYEGFGLPPLEAMACGCPVVVSKIASLPEVCGDAALYVDPHDVESIARGMAEVVNKKQLRNDLIEKGKKRAPKGTSLTQGVIWPRAHLKRNVRVVTMAFGSVILP